jgi:hypothetical protein
MEHSTTRVDELVALNLAAGERLEIIERGRNGRARLTGHVMKLPTPRSPKCLPDCA